MAYMRTIQDRDSTVVVHVNLDVANLMIARLIALGEPFLVEPPMADSNLGKTVYINAPATVDLGGLRDRIEKDLSIRCPR